MGVNESDRLNADERDRRLSSQGESLYKLLNVEKSASPDEIKKSYRKLALKYHPDKNRDNPDAADKFKEINKANAVLSDDAKKEIYDKYGSRGLQLLDQMGPDALKVWMKMNHPLAKCCFITIFCFTGCCCCFCCCCCCNCCCGKFKPSDEEEAGVPSDLDDPDGPITSQPTSEIPKVVIVGTGDGGGVEGEGDVIDGTFPSPQEGGDNGGGYQKLNSEDAHNEHQGIQECV